MHDEWGSDQYPGYPNGKYFYHTDVVGEEVYEPDPSVENHYAWVCYKGIHSPGYMQKGLIHLYKDVRYAAEQNIIRPDSDEYDSEYDPLTFYARFRMKATNLPGPGECDIVRLEVVLRRDPDQYTPPDTVLASQVVTNYAFVDSGAVNAYADFILDFQVSSELERTYSRWDTSQGFDYRVWWYGTADVYLDRVELRDQIYQKLITGGYDEELKNKITTYSPSRRGPR